MGVAGSGKTTVGKKLAESLRCPFYEGDDFHPSSNIEKMKKGIALTDEDREPAAADEFAEAGYVAILPDLLSGMAPNGGRTKDFPADGVGPARRLPLAQVAADLNALADYSRKLPACNGKVCVVGFSWGGDVAFRFATTRRDLSAAFVFYGAGPEPEAISNIQAPVYGFYAGTDTRVLATVPATQQQMKAAGKFYETVTYEGAAHGFMQSGARPDAPAADKKAWDAAWIKLKALREKFN